MSVIAVRVYDNKIKIAADSIVITGYSKRTDTSFAKLFEENGMIIGGCGLAQDNSLMQRFAETHKPLDATEKEVLQFIIEFSKWKSDISGDSQIDNDYIMVYKNKAFVIVSMFVIEVNNYYAIGAGSDFANAAMYLGHSPKKAVETACELSCYVAKPIIEYKVDFNEEESDV